MKKLEVAIYFSSVVVIAACSSSSKVNHGDSDASQAFSNAESVDLPDSRDSKRSSDSPKPTTPSSLQAELGEAVKKGSNIEIARVGYRILSIDSKNIYALNALAIVHYRKNEFTAAQLLLERALKENPKSSDLHNNMALVKLGMNDNREAIHSFRTALSLNPNDRNAAANVGALYLQNKDYRKALLVMELATESANDKRVLMNYAVALVANKNYEKAEGLYKNLMKNSPSDKNIMFNYSILLIDHLGKNKEGLDLVSKIKFLGPSSEIESKISALENKAKTGLK